MVVRQGFGKSWDGVCFPSWTLASGVSQHVCTWYVDVLLEEMFSCSAVEADIRYTVNGGIWIEG